jgi:hypothetical protein
MVCLVLSLVFTGIAFSANAKKHHPRHPGIPHFRQWVCIHNGEGAWNANTGNGYYGGLQMDRSFQHTYGHRYYHRRGTANHWTPREQMLAAERAWKTRGFYPWPTTARACGLI